MKRTTGSRCLLGALWLSAAFAASGADIDVPLERAAAAARAGEHAAAIAALETALDAVRAEAPLALEAFQLVSRPAALFGDFVPRKDAVFAADDELRFYLEPKNLVYPEVGGVYRPGLEVDLEVIDAEGDMVARKEKFGAFRFASRSRLQDIYLNLTVTLTGAPPGEYTVRFVVRDLHSAKSARVERKITLQ
jgi:hypothetical protein